MTQINANTHTTILLCLFTFAAATSIGVLTARWISGQIGKLNSAARGIASGDLNQHVEAGGIVRIVEVDNLAGSFNSMAGQLKESFTVLEARNEALQIAEENYRGIYENALEGIFQSSPNGGFLTVNPAMARIFGYESPEHMVTSVTQIKEKIYVEATSWEEFQLMAEHSAVKGFEHQAYRSDNSIIWVEENARAIRDNKSGEVLYYEGIIEDITERKRKEKELKRQLEELRIEIDQRKRQKEVAQITQSGYFQELQSEAENLRSDDW